METVAIGESKGRGGSVREERGRGRGGRGGIRERKRWEGEEGIREEEKGRE